MFTKTTSVTVLLLEFVMRWRLFSKGNAIYYQKAPCDGSHILHAFAQSEKEIINWLS